MEAHDFQGNVIRLTIPYDDDAHGATHAINGAATLHRDASCVYAKAVVGNPASPTITVSIPSGDHSFTVAQMSAAGLTNLDQINSTQITFIP